MTDANKDTVTVMVMDVIVDIIMAMVAVMLTDIFIHAMDMETVKDITTAMETAMDTVTAMVKTNNNPNY